MMAAENAAASRWWRCANELARDAQLDALCISARRAGERLALVSGSETVISNLSVAENILLPAAWHAGTANLREEVAAWLAEAFEAAELDAFLRSRPFGLSPREQERVAVARALQLQATQVVFIDDDHYRERWLDEWLAAFRRLLPRARIEVLSTRAPSEPSRWLVQAGPSFEVAA